MFSDRGSPRGIETEEKGTAKKGGTTACKIWKIIFWVLGTTPHVTTLRQGTLKKKNFYSLLNY